MKKANAELSRLIPKAELHLHVEGTLEPDLARTLALRNGVILPASLAADAYEFHNLSSFLAVYYSNMTVLRSEEDFFDLAWSYLIKARAQNVIHVEMFFDPQAHTARGVPFSAVLSGLHRAATRAGEELDMSVLLIMCFLRDMSVESAMSTLEESLPFASSIVGVGLDSDECNNPPIKFADVFARAKQMGYRLTAHCDIDQHNSIEHIRQALCEIGVERLDHGTNIVEDPTLVALVKSRGIGLTCCSISNSFVTPHSKSKEILALLHDGVRTTINSDDPAYFKGYVEENLLLFAATTEASEEDLINLQRNAFEIAWVSEARRAELFGRLNDFLRTFRP